MRKSEEVTIFT